MRVLVVAPQPFFSPRGTPFSVYYRSLILAQMGVTIDLLTYGQGQDVEIPGVRIIRIPKFRFLGPVKVGPSLLKLFLDIFLFAWTVGLLLRRRYDLVHAHEEAVFFCRLLKPVFRFKLLYDMHSSLPQQLTNFGFTRSRVLIRMFEKLEDSCLMKAEAVITISPALADYAMSRGVDSGRHFLIENSIFEDVLLKNESPTSSESLGEASIARDQTVVGYAGTFEEYQGIDLLIRAFAEARKVRDDLFLLLIGGSEDQVDTFRQLAAELGLAEACRFCGTLPQADARRLMSRADVLPSPRTRGTNTPLKIYELLASGKPIVATRIVSHTQVLSEEVCYLADPDPREFGNALLEALESGPEQRRRVAAGRALYENSYSRRAYEDKIQALLELLD